MDTPERAPTSQQHSGSTPVSRVEDSPVFNFLNNLSPIKPEKPLRITQTFQSLSFPPISSIFGSPHVSVQKEHKFVLTHHLSHSPTSNIGDRSQKCSDEFDIPKPLDIAAGRDCISYSHPSNAAVDHLANDHNVRNDKLSHTSQHNVGNPNGSPNHNATFYDVTIDTNLEVGSSLLIDFVHHGMEERDLFKSDLPSGSMQMQRLDQDHEVSVCKWKTMISDNAENPLLLDSCIETEASHGQSEIPDQGSKFAIVVSGLPEETTDISSKIQAGESSQSFFPEVLLEPPENLDDIQEQNVMSDLPRFSLIDEKKQISSSMEVDFQHQRGARRRCLLYDMAGANKRNTFTDLTQAAPDLVSDEKHTNSQKSGTCSSPRALPGIGLHLNSLASSSKDRLCRSGDLASLKDQISTLEKLPQVSSSIEDNRSVGGENLDLQVISIEPETAKDKEPNSRSPKKKRYKLENNNENEACKRCNCKKSRCLKLYCECFAAGVYCVEPCTCQDCFNKPMNEDIVLSTRNQIESRNPLAFAPKVIKASEPAAEIGHEEANKTPASARHKRGCNCKKSNCLKKYCECFQGGAGCSVSCRCEGCKNTFGTKDGKHPKNSEDVNLRDGGADPGHVDGIKLDDQQSAQINEPHNLETILPITPSFLTLKPCSKPAVPSSGKPPRSTMVVIGSSQRMDSFKARTKPEAALSCHFTEQSCTAAPMEETPDILKSGPPHIKIKVSSPSRKRVSTPHNERQLSPSHKGSRKLILKSIPSFPSLCSETNGNHPPILSGDSTKPNSSSVE